MMAEIYQRGPIACGISVTEELYKHYTGGVFYDKTNATNIDHDISVVGYGVDKPTGLKYWLIRNSWGTYWVREQMSCFCKAKNLRPHKIVTRIYGLEIINTYEFFCRVKMEC